MMSTQAIRLVLTALLVWMGSYQVRSQIARGRVDGGITIGSETLGKRVRYSIYLPPDYESSHRLYPVVYLLHGYSDNDTGWLQSGEANRIADEG
jgi:S-formylglutathione hydrolase FrmB